MFAFICGISIKVGFLQIFQYQQQELSYEEWISVFHGSWTATINHKRQDVAEHEEMFSYRTMSKRY